jgi:hypothetical protein
LTLLLAIIVGDTRRFRPLVDICNAAGRKAGFSPGHLEVSRHSPGHVAPSTEQAVDDFYADFARAVSDICKDRWWDPWASRASSGGTRTVVRRSPLTNWMRQWGVK